MSWDKDCLTAEQQNQVERLAAHIVEVCLHDSHAVQYLKELVGESVCLSCGSSSGRDCQCENDE